MDDSNVRDLSIDPDQIEQVLEERAGKPRRGRWQRRGSFMPREWELRLKQARARPATIWLAHELLYQKWRVQQNLYGSRDRPIEVSSEVMKGAGLSARSRSNALHELEQLGLIEVDRAPPRAPRATLRHVPGKSYSE
jgi:hypothetical protein